MWALFPLLPILLGISHALGTSVSTSASSTATSNDSSSVSTATTDTSSAAVSTETGDLTVPISSYTFSPFPTPKQTPVSGVFPATDPKDPPAPGNASVVPDFAPAWAAAYHKAKTRVSHLLTECFKQAASFVRSVPFLSEDSSLVRWLFSKYVMDRLRASGRVIYKEAFV